MTRPRSKGDPGPAATSRRRLAAIFAVLLALAAAVLVLTKDAPPPTIDQAAPPHEEPPRPEAPAPSNPLPLPPREAAADTAPAPDEPPAPTKAAPDLRRVRVTVLNDVREPVAGVGVEIGTLTEWDTRDPSLVFGQGLTDQEGRTDLLVLPGPYFVMANHDPNGTPASLAHGMDATEIDVSNATRDVHLVLTRRNASLLVHVRDDVGRPVQGATIAVGSSLPPATTDASGEAFVDRLTWGDQSVDLVESEIVGDRGRYCCRQPRKSLHIEQGGTAELLFEVERTGHLVARLEDSSCVGGDALLHLRQEQGGIHVSTPDVPLKPGSSHRFEQLPPGRYALRAFFPPTSDCLAPERVVATVRPGEVTEIVVPVRVETGSVTGRVVDGSGRGRGRVGILVTSHHADEALWLKTTATDSQGAFEVRGLPQTRMRVAIYPDQAEGEELAFYGTFEEPALLLPHPNQDLEIRLERGFRIRGQVVDAASHLPITDEVKVAIDRYRYPRRFTTKTKRHDDQDGIFQFGNLRAGTYRLTILDDSKAPLTPEHIVVVGDTPTSPTQVEVTLELHPPD